MLVTDAQVHLWEVDRPDRPWPKEQPRPPNRPNASAPTQDGVLLEPVLLKNGRAGGFPTPGPE